MGEDRRWMDEGWPNLSDPRERIHMADDHVYYQRNLQEGFEEIYQEDELSSSFNIDTELLSDALVGDQNDVVVPQKRKRVPRKKKLLGVLRSVQNNLILILNMIDK
jgi:hypothetical protein